MIKILKQKKWWLVLILILLAIFVWGVYFVVSYLMNLEPDTVVNQVNTQLENDYSPVVSEKIEGVVGGVITELDDSKIVLSDEGTQDKHEFNIADNSNLIVLIYDQETGTYPNKTINDLKIGVTAEIHYFIENGVRYIESIIAGADYEN